MPQPQPQPQPPSSISAASPSQSQKLKLLKLAMLLWEESDEQHPLPTMDIVNRLEELGIHCDRRTVPRDLEVLVGCGFRVCKRWNVRHLDWENAKPFQTAPAVLAYMKLNCF